MADDLDTDLSRLAPAVDTDRAGAAFRRRQRRSRAYRRGVFAGTAVVVLLAGTAAVIAATDDDTPVRTVPSEASDDGVPRVWVQPESDATDGMGAEVKGELVYVEEHDCFQIELAGVRYPVVWPARTRGTADGPGVVLWDHEVARVGDEVFGGGGYLPVADEFDIPAECLPETGEVAVYNPGERVLVTPSRRETVEGPACSDIERFGERISETGITYDYDASDSPEELTSGADVVFAGRLTGETATYESGDDRALAAIGYEIQIDAAYKQPAGVSLGEIQYAWIDLGSVELFDAFEDVAVEGIRVVVFAHRSERAPGYAVSVEGFITGCPSGPIIGRVGTQGAWVNVTGLGALQARLRTPPDDRP